MTIEQADLRSVSDRIRALQQCDLDPVDDAVLEVLQRRTCFTDRQKEALTTLEKVYGIQKINH